jgi:hypothetical protein
MFHKWRVLRKEALTAEIQRLKAALAGLGGEPLDEEDYGEELEVHAAEVSEMWQKQLEEHQQQMAAEEEAARAAAAKGDYEYEDDDAAQVHLPAGHEAAPPVDDPPVAAGGVGKPGECSDTGDGSCETGSVRDEL